MKIKCLVYVLTDANGYQSYCVANESSDIICVGGTDLNGEHHQYDSYEGYHAYGWAEEHGFRLDCIEKEFEVELPPTFWADKGLNQLSPQNPGDTCKLCGDVDMPLLPENYNGTGVPMTVQCQNCRTRRPTVEGVKLHGPAVYMEYV